MTIDKLKFVEHSCSHIQIACVQSSFAFELSKSFYGCAYAHCQWRCRLWPKRLTNRRVIHFRGDRQRLIGAGNSAARLRYDAFNLVDHITYVNCLAMQVKDVRPCQL